MRTRQDVRCLIFQKCIIQTTSLFTDLISTIENIRALSKAIEENKEIIDDSTKSDNEKLKAERALSKSKERLLELLPEEARERVRASNYSKEAIERELNILWKIQEERHKEAQNAIKAEISKTKATIKATEARIEAYGKEIDALIARNKMLAESSKLSKKFGFDGITDEYGENYEEKNNEYIEYWKKLQKEAQEERAKLQQKSNSLEQELKDVESSYNANRANIPGADGGTTNDSDNNYNNGNKGNNGNTSTYNTADDRQRAIRLAYQTRHNELWYEGNIGAKAYANSLKEVTNLEDLYGSTITSIDAKENIYKKYSKDLEAYQSELETFKKDIVTDLDKRPKLQ